MPPPDDQSPSAPAPQAVTLPDPRPDLSVFRRFAVEMIGFKSVDALYWHVAHNLVGRMNFSDCVIYSFDPDRQTLSQVAAIGDKIPSAGTETILNPLTIPLGSGITGTVAQTRSPLIVDDLHTDPRYIPDLTKARSEICVPILYGDELLGVIDCEHPLPNRFGAAELEILISVAAMTAGQVMQCRLIRQGNTTRHQLARALEASELAQQNQILFLVNASHELRTPLNSIIGFSSLLNRPGYFASDLERGESQAATILEAGQQLSAVINDILEITAAAGGRLVVTPECLDIGWEVEQAILKFQSDDAPALIVIEPVGDVETLQGWCDVRHFHRIIANLTENAIRFSQPGSPVSIAIERHDDRIDINVRDRGICIEADSLETIFGAFRRGPVGAPDGSRGAGLGLTLARELAQANLAGIDVRSDPGCGSVFTLRLPALIDGQPGAVD